MCETAAKARGSRGESPWGWACSIFQIINVWCIYRQLPIFTQVRHSDTRSLKNRWIRSHDHILQDTSKCSNSSVEILSQFRDNTTSLHPAVRASQSVLRSSCNNVPEWKPSGRSQIQVCEEYKLPLFMPRLSHWPNPSNLDCHQVQTDPTWSWTLFEDLISIYYM